MEIYRDKNKKDGDIIDKKPFFLDFRLISRLPLSRFGSQRDQQRISNKNGIAIGNPIHDKHDGTSSFRSMRYDIKQRRE